MHLIQQNLCEHRWLAQSRLSPVSTNSRYIKRMYVSYFMTIRANYEQRPLYVLLYSALQASATTGDIVWHARCLIPFVWIYFNS